MGCYKSPDGQGQLGDPKGEACQLPGSVWFRTKIPSIKLEICSAIPGQPVRLHSLLFHAQLHRTVGCCTIDQRTDIPLHLCCGSVPGRASGFTTYICRYGLRSIGCRAVPDGQDVKENPSAVWPHVCLKGMTDTRRQTHTTNMLLILPCRMASACKNALTD